MFRNWRELGNLPPVIENDKRRKSFEVVLRREALLTEKQIAFQRSLGVRLIDDQAEAFAYLCRVRSATVTELRAVVGQTASKTQQTLNALATQMLVRLPVHGQTVRLATHLELALDEVEPDVVANSRPSKNDAVDASLDQAQLRIVQACDVPRSITELVDSTGLPRRDFRRRYLQPLLDLGIVRMADAANPRARNQRYVLTDAGVAQKARQVAGDTGGDSGQS